MTESVKPVSLINPLTDEYLNGTKKRGWTATVTRVIRNGDMVFEHPEVLENIRSIELSHPSFGVCKYGLTQAGYDGWAFHEHGGGGAVILPHALITERHEGRALVRLYVGLLLEQRHNQGGKVWNCPRGFIEPGENPFEAAKRELAEELLTKDRFDPARAEVFPLKGRPGNPNSAFFETPGADEGTKFYAAAFNANALVPDNAGGYVFKDGLLRPDARLDAKQKAMGERILKSRFVHWTEAAQVSDQFTCTAVARLLVHMRDRNPSTFQF